MIQRQKLEYRNLRKKIEELKQKRMRLNKKTQKNEKKEITKEIKRLQEGAIHLHNNKLIVRNRFERKAQKRTSGIRRD